MGVNFNLSDNLNLNGKYSIRKSYFCLFFFSKKNAFSEKHVAYRYIYIYVLSFGIQK